MKTLCYTAGELADRIQRDRRHWIPEDFMPGTNLVYSSPATLAYNSPGAEGYGVKRTALCVPESVELIISPGCCGRNTSDISSMEGYEDRFYYLTMDEADLVTGRHLRRIPDAVKQILKDRQEKGLSAPEVVMLLTTCVDALLGTDMEHVAKICEKECAIKVRPAYMYALTREGVKPPMAQVRESIYSLLEKKKKNPRMINFIGYPAGIDDQAESELASIFGSMGITSFNSISRCHTYNEFQEMAEANFNVVLDPQARAAASYMEKNLNIGSAELQRFYGIDRISSQYSVLLTAFDSPQSENDSWYDWCRRAMDGWDDNMEMYDERPVFAIGECADAEAPELALSLIEYGYEVREVFTTFSEDDAYYVSEIAEKSPDTKFYFNQHPTMVSYECDPDVSFCIGRDAVWYYHNEDVASLSWNRDVQPFGYHGVTELMSSICWEWGHYMSRADDEVSEHIHDVISNSGWDDEEDTQTPQRPRAVQSPDTMTSHLLGIMGFGKASVAEAAMKQFVPLMRKKVHGYRHVLTPFAPDQSGAASIVFPMKSLTVILDAGGCTGNICGFDEPRWEKNSAMIFSAGLRDMDAVLGRDKELIAKIEKACEELKPEFITLIGTPVPSTIGTDYTGLKKEIRKKTGLRVVSIPTNGMDLYDSGMQLAYLYLSTAFADGSENDLTGVWGLDFLDYSSREMREIVEKMIADGIEEAYVYGVNTGAYEYISGCRKNIAFSVSGYDAAGGVIAPPEYIVSDHIAEQALKESARADRVLIVGEQVYSNALRTIIHRRYPGKQVKVAGFFTMIDELRENGDVHMKEEDDLVSLVHEYEPSLIIGDPALMDLLPDYDGHWVWRIHFALSGSRGIQR